MNVSKKNVHHVNMVQNNTKFKSLLVFNFLRFQKEAIVTTNYLFKNQKLQFTKKRYVK